MMFLIYCVDDPTKGPASEELRGVHRTYLFETFKEQVQYGGPTFKDDGTTIDGRVMFADFPTRADAEAFVKNEPYFKAGQVQRYDIKPMRMAIKR